MNQNKYINIMISSKNNSKFSRKHLTDVRRKLKKYIEESYIFKEQIFTVTINEDLPAENISKTTWERCIDLVNECNILLVLYNGDSGWTIDDGQIGICHEELSQGIRMDAQKVIIINIGEVELDDSDEKKKQRDIRFRNYVNRMHKFSCNKVETMNDLKLCVASTLHKAVIDLTIRKLTGDKKGLNHIGEALEWNKLDFYHRAEMIKDVLKNSIEDMSSCLIEENNFFLVLKGKSLLFQVHAIPASFSISTAREMVGQPFLEDHKIISNIKIDFEGPVHIIGCHKSITETQAMKILGFPDAVVLKTHFGIYVADNIQKIQMIFISNCTDTERTRSGFQQMYEWLTSTNELDSLIERAESRKKIIDVIAKENLGTK